MSMILFVILAVVIIVAAAGLGFYNIEESEMKIGKATGISAVLAVIGLAIVWLITSIAVVPTGHTGIVTVFGSVKDATLTEGFHLLTPWETVINMDNRIQKISGDMSGTTSDMQDVTINFTLNYQIEKTNASKIYQNIGVDYEETVIKALVANTVKSVMAKYPAVELISQRTSVSAATTSELKNVLAKYNIEVVDTAIENMDFSKEFNASIEAKVIAEQELERAQTEQAKKTLEIEAEAKRKVTEAQGIADANAILSNSYTKEILQKMFLDKWDGKLPSVVGGADNMLDVSAYIK